MSGSIQLDAGLFQERAGQDDAFNYARTAAAFREHRYLKIPQLLPKALVEFLKVYYGILLADLSNSRFVRGAQCPLSLSLGGDPALDAVLEWIRPQVGRLVGLELAPTLSYTRVYAKDEILARHIDREACEISVSVSISIPDGMGPSYLCLKPPNVEPIKVEMQEGDGCIFAGTEVEHWRDGFPCDGYIQLFLFFINTHGPFFPEHLYDKRDFLGA